MINHLTSLLGKVLLSSGADNDLKEKEGYDYLQSNSASDYATNLNRLVQSNTDLIFGVGFKHCRGYQ